MDLKAGTSIDDISSMTAAIEHAFRREWPNVMGGQELPSTTDPYLKIMFVAVAQGVVKYLHNNPDAFRVTISGGNHSHSGQVNTIRTTGTLY